jgi:hypothetical protein
MSVCLETWPWSGGQLAGQSLRKQIFTRLRAFVGVVAAVLHEIQPLSSQLST